MNEHSVILTVTGVTTTRGPGAWRSAASSTPSPPSSTPGSRTCGAGPSGRTTARSPTSCRSKPIASPSTSTVVASTIASTFAVLQCAPSISTQTIAHRLCYCCHPLDCILDSLLLHLDDRTKHQATIATKQQEGSEVETSSKEARF